MELSLRPKKIAIVHSSVWVLEQRREDSEKEEGKLGR